MDRLSNALSLDVSLSDLQQGETAIIGKFDLEPQVAEHLMNLGFVAGIEVTVAQSGPGGDPRVYRVEGTAVALRRDLAERITVRPLPAKLPVPAVAPAEAVLALGSQASAD